MKKLVTITSSFIILGLSLYLLFYDTNAKDKLNYIEEKTESIYSDLKANPSSSLATGDKLIQRSNCQFIQPQEDTYCTVSTSQFVYKLEVDNFEMSINSFDEFIRSLGFKISNPSNKRLLYEQEIYSQGAIDSTGGDLTYTKIEMAENPIRYIVDFKFSYEGDCINNISQRGDVRINITDIESRGSVDVCTTISAQQLIPGRIDWNTPNRSESDGPTTINRIE